MTTSPDNAMDRFGYTESQMEEIRNLEESEGIQISGVSGSLEADLGRKIIGSIRAALSAGPGKNAAYREWLLRLRPGDQLPRGRFFRRKEKLSPFFIYDEWEEYSANHPGE